MPRKPNYKFERHERDRAKAAKKALRLEAKKEKSEKRNSDDADIDPAGDALVDPSDEQPEGALRDDDPDR